MKIAFGCDHAGYILKDVLFAYFKEKGIEVIDHGTFNGTDSVDYPDYAVPVCKSLQNGEADFGVLACGTGVGVSITANKMKGIRCALTSDTFTAHATREHNDANAIALGGRVTGPDLAVELVDTFLHAAFSHGERHQKRIGKIMAVEQG
jgi:ribose 5-phosphate isomerase B